jgi:hypothetical protein
MLTIATHMGTAMLHTIHDISIVDTQSSPHPVHKRLIKTRHRTPPVSIHILNRLPFGTLRSEEVRALQTFRIILLRAVYEI